MIILRKTLLLICSALVMSAISLTSFAVIETYQFSNDELRERFYQLNEELRCPKCQNQNLSDSDAPIAADLREQVYRLLNEGKTDEEVKAYLVERYGEYVLYRPQWSKQTWLLWLAPVILLAVGLIVVFVMVRRRTSVTAQGSHDSLSKDDQQRLESLLQQENKQKEDN